MTEYDHSKQDVFEACGVDEMLFNGIFMTVCGMLKEMSPSEAVEVIEGKVESGTLPLRAVAMFAVAMADMSRRTAPVPQRRRNRR